MSSPNEDYLRRFLNDSDAVTESSALQPVPVTNELPLSENEDYLRRFLNDDV